MLKCTRHYARIDGSTDDEEACERCARPDGSIVKNNNKEASKDYAYS